MSSSSSRSSDLLTASALIATGKNRVNAISVIGDGVNAATLTVFDNTTGSGKVLAQVLVKAADFQNHVIWTFPVYAEVGLFATLTGTGAKYIVYYGA